MIDDNKNELLSVKFLTRIIFLIIDFRYIHIVNDELKEEKEMMRIANRLDANPLQ